jgi:4-hydroxy-3-methylbut-2-enyl diphosphate reductase
MAVAWCVITAFVPVFEMNRVFDADVWRQLTVVFIFTFTLVFTRSTLLDIRDIQSDLMVGVETLPILFGRKLTEIIMSAVLLVCSCALVAAALSAWVSSLGYFLLIPLGYCFVYIFLYHRGHLSQGMSAEIAANAGFFVSGGVALVYHLLAN